MTKEEFRQKLQEILFKEYTTRNNPELQKQIIAERKELEREYKLSVITERMRTEEDNKKVKYIIRRREDR